MRRFALSAILLLATLAPDPARAQNEVRYSASTGAITGLPLRPGRTYTIVVENLHPLCYAYSAEINVKEDNADLSKLITAFGALPGAPAPSKTTEPAAPAAPPAKGPVAPAAAPGAGAGAALSPAARAQALAQATQAVTSAEEKLKSLSATVTTMEGVVGRVNSPACSRTASFQALENEWDAHASTRQDLVAAPATIGAARALLAAAGASLVTAGPSPAATAVKNRLDAATTDAGTLAAKTATLIPELRTAEGAMAAARDQDHFKTEAYLPAGTSSVDFTLRTTEMRPKAGATAATTELKTSLATRRGMRVFLSAGYLASTASLHDYERANRPCPAGATFTCETTYSTYVDRTPGVGGFAFSPVLQANVALPDWRSSGVSLHASAGVAARSVNGTVSPEFILGGGTGFLDRFLVTAGVHLARDEKLLLGDAAAVESRPVSDKITAGDAISVVWRTAFVGTVTFRLN
ncbi:MAG TPA: hypothetical protein VEX86_16615 [Longimicrobium sp.]|nr:hypothetical protein [Longimicrobium sp.]